MDTKKIHKIEDDVATNFVVSIIDEAMERYSISYNTVVKILKELKYWDIFDNSGVTTVGAHEGIEPVIREIGEYLK